MSIDKKEIIAETARKLLMEKQVKKLTVKDIVEECQITRQTFYYHFEDIPALFRWALEKSTKQMLQEIERYANAEDGLRYFFLMAAQVAPVLKKGRQSNYRDELDGLLTEYVYRFFEQIIERENLYQDCSRSELKFVLRYHSQAVIGLLHEWTEADTRQLDQIVRYVYRVIVRNQAELDKKTEV